MKSIFSITFLTFTAIINISFAFQLEFRCNGPSEPCDKAIDNLGRSNGFTFVWFEGR